VSVLVRNFENIKTVQDVCYHVFGHVRLDSDQPINVVATGSGSIFITSLSGEVAILFWQTALGGKS